ncbi:hypothetical protein RRG08_039953 [Elysia crispata]|uniref:Uncharacterized protein n=1 Tax=Elysia crispata TaxID=231223 RepID=A0AAE1DBH8_9GAST|nr:hypothetical protein RRG08_039953 [Elysia crispata]
MRRRSTRYSHHSIVRGVYLPSTGNPTDQAGAQAQLFSYSDAVCVLCSPCESVLLQGAKPESATNGIGMMASLSGDMLKGSASNPWPLTRSDSIERTVTPGYSHSLPHRISLNGTAVESVPTAHRNIHFRRYRVDVATPPVHRCTLVGRSHGRQESFDKNDSERLKRAGTNPVKHQSRVALARLERLHPCKVHRSMVPESKAHWCP